MSVPDTRTTGGDHGPRTAVRRLAIVMVTLGCGLAFRSALLTAIEHGLPRSLFRDYWGRPGFLTLYWPSLVWASIAVLGCFLVKGRFPRVRGRLTGAFFTRGRFSAGFFGRLLAVLCPYALWACIIINSAQGHGDDHWTAYLAFVLWGTSVLVAAVLAPGNGRSKLGWAALTLVTGGLALACLAAFSNVQATRYRIQMFGDTEPLLPEICVVTGRAAETEGRLRSYSWQGPGGGPVWFFRSKAILLPFSREGLREYKRQRPLFWKLLEGGLTVARFIPLVPVDLVWAGFCWVDLSWWLYVLDCMRGKRRLCIAHAHGIPGRGSQKTPVPTFDISVTSQAFADEFVKLNPSASVCKYQRGLP